MNVTVTVVRKSVTMPVTLHKGAELPADYGCYLCIMDDGQNWELFYDFNGWKDSQGNRYEVDEIKWWCHRIAVPAFIEI